MNYIFHVIYRNELNTIFLMLHNIWPNKIPKSAIILFENPFNLIFYRGLFFFSIWGFEILLVSRLLFNIASRVKDKPNMGILFGAVHKAMLMFQDSLKLNYELCMQSAYVIKTTSTIHNMKEWQKFSHCNNGGSDFDVAVTFYGDHSSNDG